MAIKIFIDQGHNPSGPNTGAEGFGLKEQDITYQVGKELAELLRADDRFEVRLSRNTPEERLGTSNTTSLAARVRAANAWPADYFISIHANAISAKVCPRRRAISFNCRAASIFSGVTCER